MRLYRILTISDTKDTELIINYGIYNIEVNIIEFNLR